MEFKGTKGNWKSSEGTKEILIASENRSVCKTWAKQVEDEANAKLIAAAPDLLDALLGLLDWNAHLPELANNEIIKAKKAIKKALEI